MGEETDPLLRHLSTIYRALDSVRSTICYRETPRSLPNRRDLARFFLYGDLNEAATLLRLICKITRDLRDVNAPLLERATAIATGEKHERRIEPTSEEGVLWQRRLELTPELTVLTKALYEWLYHIHEDIEIEPTLRNAVPLEVRARLDRYCAFRNKLVTHKKGREVYASSGIRGHMNDPSRNEILLIPVEGLPEAAIQSLGALFEAAKGYLDAAVASEENIFERMAILYRRLDQFPGPLQGRVKTFMEQYGGISDTPIELAAFLDDFTNAVVSSLAQR